MKLSVTLLLALFATLFCIAQCQLSGSTLYVLDPVNSQLKSYSFATQATNTTSLDFTNFYDVLQGNYGTLDKKYVVYLDQNKQFNVGYLNIDSGDTTSIATYQLPTLFTSDMFIRNSFGYDVVTGNLYCLGFFNNQIFMVTLYPNAPAFALNTGIELTNSVTGTFDPVSQNYYIMNIPNNQYVISVYYASNKTVSDPYTLKAQWMVYSQYQSSIIANNGQVYIAQLVPAATNYLFQVILDENKPQLNQLTTSNLPAYYFNILTAAITSQYVFYVSGGAGVPNSILNTYQLNDFSSTSLITLPFSLTASQIIFVQ